MGINPKERRRVASLEPAHKTREIRGCFGESADLSRGSHGFSEHGAPAEIASIFSERPSAVCDLVFDRLRTLLPIFPRRGLCRRCARSRARASEHTRNSVASLPIDATNDRRSDFSPSLWRQFGRRRGRVEERILRLGKFILTVSCRCLTSFALASSHRGVPFFLVQLAVV